MVFTDRPVVCGHRGSGRGAGENTLGSHRRAVEAGATWVEVDARFTADDVLVARHDPTAGDGRFVSEMAAAETDRLGIMRLADLLDDLAAHVGVNVEIKSSLEDAQRPRERTTAALVAAELAGHGDRRPLLVTSFDPAAVLTFRALRPGVAVGLLTWMRFPLRKAIAAAAQLGCEVLAAQKESFPTDEEAPRRGERPIARSLAVAHDAGLEVVAWCPGPEEAARLTAGGVDCVIVDDVPAVVARLATPPRR